MKARYILIILVVNYAIMVFVSGLIELHALTEKAKQVQITMRTAADMALEQTQVIDDYLAYEGRESYKLLMPSSSGDGFVYADLFGGVFGLDSNIGTNHQLIYDRLYNNSDFRDFATTTGAIRRPVKYWNNARTGFTWYYIPTISMIGLDILPSDKSVRGVKDVYGNYTSDAFSAELLSAYGLNNHVKTTGGKRYYNTPLNIGVTYLNPELLGTLFMNNMDLLMRLKYDANLNTEEGGNGVLKGKTYADRVTGDVSMHNPINDGNFTLLRGQKNVSTSGVETYRGITPSISYKVIDMYDSANDPLLIHLFGAYKGSYPSKAEYLKDLDRDVLNPVTNAPFTRKPIVVAKVEFYADIIVPYFSIIMRDFRSSLGGTDNYVELLPESPSGVAGTRRMVYTRYFAVTP